MSSIKLKHSSGNGVSITAPSSNPAADRTLELPSDADGIIAKTDASGNLAVTGDLTVDTDTLKVDSSNNRVAIGHTSPATNLDVKTAHVSNEANFYVRNNTVNYKVRTLSDQVQAGAETNHPFYVISNNQYVARFDGDGIKFGSDTAAANALDDYEEGTWTASVNFGNHITTNAAYYTKIGQMVFWHLHFRPTFAPNDTAVYQIYGLPFTSKNVTENYGWTANIVYTANANNSNIANMRPLVEKNNTYIYFHTVGLGNSVRVLNNLIRSALVGHDTLMGGFYMAA